MRRFAFWIGVLLPALIGPPEACAHDWAHWRGPHRNGISDETGWIHEWPAEGPKTAWKASVGMGFSSFVIGKGRVFTMGYRDDQDVVCGLDATTGREIWKHAYPAELGDKYFEGGTTGTPTLEGDRVFSLSRWGDAFCFDAADGKILWSRNVQKDTGARPPDWGYTGAPLVLGGRVYLTVGGGGLALDRNSGEILWKSDDKPAGYSSPLPFGDGLAVFSSGEGYSAVRLSDGKRVWSVRWLTQFGVNAADPVLQGDLLFISSGYGKGSGLFKLGTADPEPVWKSKVLATQMNAAVLFEGHLYGTAGDSTEKASLKCVELATGKEKWVEANFGSGGVVIADGRILALSGSGELMTAPATPAGFAPTARAQVLGGRTWTAPVLANGAIYCRNSRGDVVCVDARP